MLSRPRIVFFSGLGCDARMVDRQRGIDADLEYQPWLEPLPNESLKSYAARVALLIDRSTPFYLAGISLGGMVAQEVAARCDCVGLILLATTRTRAGVPWPQRVIARLVAGGPRWFIGFGKTIVPHMRQLFGIDDERDVELFKAMMSDASDDLIAWSLKAVAGWEGARQAHVPTLQIHGELDKVLPLKLAGPVDYAIEGAGHAVSVSHAAQVDELVNHWLAMQARP